MPQSLNEWVFKQASLSWHASSLAEIKCSKLVCLPLSVKQTLKVYNISKLEVGSSLAHKYSTRVDLTIEKHTSLLRNCRLLLVVPLSPLFCSKGPTNIFKNYKCITSHFECHLRHASNNLGTSLKVRIKNTKNLITWFVIIFR